MKSLGEYLGFQRGDRKAHNLRAHNRETVRRYVAANHLSTIPSILARIDAICRDPQAGVDTFAQIYQMDKAASARLVRTANSVAYATREGNAILGIRDAVVRVGFAKAREILHASTVCGLYKAHLAVADYSAVELWKHSMAVAFAMRRIFETALADIRPAADPYLAGLLHDLGISIEHACLYHEGFAAAVAARKEEGTNLIVQEQKYLALTHPEIGHELAGAWKFPEGLTAAIAHHHSPDNAPESARQFLHALRAAEWLCLIAGIGYSDIAANEAPAYAISLQAAKINEAVFEKMKNDLLNEMENLNTLGWFSSLQIKR